MKSIAMFLGIAVVIFAAAGFCAGSAIGTPAHAQVQQERAFQGTLLKVDPDNHMLTVKAADLKEWIFIYGEDTRVIGPAKDVDGLTGKPGVNLKISYHIEGLVNRATQVEIMP
jgi:hypothetical protein